MMEVDRADTAIVCNYEDGPIKLDANQLAAFCHVNGVVEESGRRIKGALRRHWAHPAQCSIGVENDR